ncbi:helix-turn-helix domain-containing protein [Dyadobacter sp. CY312]|uniref:helix-turn-helix domain-containing protein n=1 Tax=Dyadobacter sp. CY312 TaxID=2907303 RepID=UPI001F1D886D|nr:helix-turn-helix transcriptional regulator [Dyadobacter sp. CY312]MCE7044458.1 helix-turn-helix transcriptional regulator [Dyadobacter sp. CY312]
MIESDNFTILDNKTIGRNLALFRKLREKKAIEVAEYIGIGEAAYTKYERGEAKITIEIIQKVAELLKIDPLQMLSVKPGTFVENVTNSSIAIQENSIFQTTNDQQTQLMLKLIENVVAMNERLVTLLEKKEEE